MVKKQKPFFIRKRDGQLQRWQKAKLIKTLKISFSDARGKNGFLEKHLVEKMEKLLKTRFKKIVPGTEDLLKIVEEVLIDKGYGDVANAYLLRQHDPEKQKRIKEFFGIKDELHVGINAMWLLQKRYLLRDREGAIVETPTQLFRRVAQAVAKSELAHKGKQSDVDRWAQWYFEMMSNRAFLPNTPTLMNAGTKSSQLAACFVLPLNDSVEGIFETLKLSAKIQKTGGGAGFDFSVIRPKGDPVSFTGGEASGPMSFLQLFDAATEVMKQGGKRCGANMAVLHYNHPDIDSFIRAKKHSGDLAHFNLSVAVTDSFMRAAQKGKEMSLINPRTKKKVGKKMADQLFSDLVKQAWKIGDPGMVFMSEVNRKNPTSHLGEITAMNPCGEQPLHPWESCVLGSINLTRMFKGVPMKGEVDWGLLRQVIHGAVRFLDSTIDVNQFPSRRIKEAVLGNRRIGIGVMGFAEMLIHLGVPYDSKQAIKEAERIMKFIKTEGHRASQQLGRERGSFPNFKGSLWDKKGKKFMRNATVTTIAPTGSISILANCSSGIEPLFAVSYLRHSEAGVDLLETSSIFEKIARQHGFWSSELLYNISKTGSVQGERRISASIQRLFKTAHEIPVEQHIKIQAAFQKYTDNAVSKTINLPKRATEEDVRKAFLLAWKMKCKGVTIYRYGSQAKQVLTVESLSQNQNKQLVATKADYSGGCPTGICMG